MKVKTTLIVKILVIFLGLVLVFSAEAVFNDVQLGTGSTLQVTVGGSILDLTVVNGNVETLNVNAGSLDIALAVNSSIDLTSADRRTFTITPQGVATVFECGGSSSTITISAPSGSSITANVIPTATTCVVQGVGGGGGTPTASPSSSPSGGGGGGGGTIPTPSASPSPTPAVTPAIPAIPAVPGGPRTPATAAVPAVPVSPTLAASPVFNSNFGLGSRGGHVRRLQQLLNSDPDTRVVDSGPGSSQNPTEIFGLLTQKGVIKFQIKYGIIAGANSPGAGNIGPKTRAKLRQVFGGGTPPQPTLPSSLSPSAPQVGAPAPTTANLQAQLQAARERLNALLQQLQQRRGQ